MKKITSHEPEEELMSVNEAFEDARASEARWRVFDTEHGLKRVFIELPLPLYNRLERIARQQHRSVPILIERVIEDLAVTFGNVT